LGLPSGLGSRLARGRFRRPRPAWLRTLQQPNPARMVVTTTCPVWMSNRRLAAPQLARVLLAQMTPGDWESLGRSSSSGEEASRLQPMKSFVRCLSAISPDPWARCLRAFGADGSLVHRAVGSGSAWGRQGEVDVGVEVRTNALPASTLRRSFAIQSSASASVLNRRTDTRRVL
jgi:hypothetical protein